jgi:hypothetical protein
MFYQRVTTGGKSYVSLFLPCSLPVPVAAAGVDHSTLG